jgi:hypothetical protein
MATPQPFSEDAVAAADKEMEERANRAKELLSRRYHGLKNQQVGWCCVFCGLLLLLLLCRRCILLRVMIDTESTVAV